MTLEPFRPDKEGKGKEGNTYVRTTTTEERSIRELEAHGIADAERLLRFATPDAIIGACRWHDHLPGTPGTGVLVNAIKAGGKPGWQPEERRIDIAARSASYQAEVWQWIADNFPECCGTDPRLVELERQLHGDAWADRLAASTLPHPAAVNAVFHLHRKHGRSLTVTEHGPAIRRAVRQGTQAAIDECELLLARRKKESA